MNSNHLVSPKQVLNNNQRASQSTNYSPSHNNDQENIPAYKRSQIQSYSSNSQPLTQRFMGSDNTSKFLKFFLIIILENESYSNLRPKL